MKIHIVQQGDTLAKIATQYGVALEELLRVNHQVNQSDPIMPGMKIKVPVRLAPLRSRGEPKGDVHTPARPRKEMPVQRETAEPQIPSTLPRTIEPETIEEEEKQLERERVEQEQQELRPTEPQPRMEVPQNVEPPQRKPRENRELPQNREAPPDGEPRQPNPQLNSKQQQNNSAHVQQQQPVQPPGKGVPLFAHQPFAYHAAARQPVLPYRMPPSHPASFRPLLAASSLFPSPMSVPNPSFAVPAPYASAMLPGPAMLPPEASATLPGPAMPLPEASPMLPVPMLPLPEASPMMAVPVLPLPLPEASPMMAVPVLPRSEASPMMLVPVLPLPEASAMLPGPAMPLPEASALFPYPPGSTMVPGYQSPPQSAGRMDAPGSVHSDSGRNSRTNESEPQYDDSAPMPTDYPYEAYRPYGYYPTDSVHDSAPHSGLSSPMQPPYQPMAQLPHSDVWPSWGDEHEESSSYR